MQIYKKKRIAGGSSLYLNDGPFQRFSFFPATSLQLIKTKVTELRLRISVFHKFLTSRESQVFESQLELEYFHVLFYPDCKQGKVNAHKY